MTPLFSALVSAPLPQRGIDIALVCGGRLFADFQFIAAELDLLHLRYKFRVMVHGEADGADTLAKKWAMRRGVQPCGCPALWDYYRAHGNVKSAGSIRNRNMLLLRPQLVIAFPGHNGTKNMLLGAALAGVPFIDLSDKYSEAVRCI